MLYYMQDACHLNIYKQIPRKNKIYLFCDEFMLSYQPCLLNIYSSSVI